VIRGEPAHNTTLTHQPAANAQVNEMPFKRKSPELGILLENNNLGQTQTLAVVASKTRIRLVLFRLLDNVLASDSTYYLLTLRARYVRN